MNCPLELEAHHCAPNDDPLPVVLTRACGTEVWDQDGHRYLDLMSACSAVSLGHGHPRILRALADQVQRLAVLSSASRSDRLGRFLARACTLTGQDMALPMNTGAEAVETALKAARRWAYRAKRVPAERAEIIVCNGNFHGRTIALIALSSDASVREDFGPFPPGFVRIPYGDAGALEAAITPNTAAFLVEPIQGEGGVIVPPPGYLRACAEICRRHQVLLLCDEIQTGLGRTGHLLACEHEGVRPDGVMLGKALGGGVLPVALLLGRREVLELLTPGSHGSTFGGNPLAAAVGLATLDVLVEDRLPQRAARLGERFMAALRALDSPLVREIRGRGLFVGMEVEPAAGSGRAICERLLAHGVLTKETRGTTIRLAPPLTISEAELDEAVERIGAALASLRSTKGR